MSDNIEKLGFKVCFCSSEDPAYSSSQLNNVKPSTKGWQSERYSIYPQEIGIELNDGLVQLSQIQLLSHQSKISRKIEIFVGKGSSYESATYKRLGYLSLDSNERSSYQARELKTVYVNHFGNYMKLIVNENHVNSLNLYNQVGIIAINIMGTINPSVDEAKGSESVNSGNRLKKKNSNPYNDLSVDMNLDPQTANKLRQLADAKSKAIDTEDYLTAKEIKQVEQELKALGSKLAQLDLAKSDAVMAEDYDLAKDIKDETDALRLEIEEKIMAIKIPGIAEIKPASRQRGANFVPAKQVYDAPLSRGNSANSRFAPDKQGPIDVDSIPVGGGGGYLDSFSPRAELEKMNSQPDMGSGKRAVSVELHHNGHKDDFDVEDDLPVMERPLKPKNQENLYGGIDDDPNSFKMENGGLGSKQNSYENDNFERFEPGDHPLEGVKGFLDLPAPEEMSSKSREIADSGGIIRMFGEYLAKCLFSKTWVLREAAISKILILMDATGNINGISIGQSLNALSVVLKVGFEDKIQQVFFNSLTLLENVLRATRHAKTAKGTMIPLFDPILSQLIEKMADSNARLREGAKKALEVIASSPNLGPGPTCSHALRALPPKQKTAWRPILSRLQILTDLVNNYGVGGNSGLSPEPILQFPKTTGSFAHSSGEVRDGAKDLVVSIQKHVGTNHPEIQTILNLLRKKQREEYETAFLGVAVTPAAQKGASPVSKKPSKPTQSPVVPPLRQSLNPEEQVFEEGEGDEEKQEFTSCMFCGVTNLTWQENDLDVHYWKDCPLLISCPSCAQIVEIAGLPEHLLDECDSKEEYVPCDVTGLAVKELDFDNWQKSDNCVPAPTNCMYCPLCLSSVEDSDEAWLSHLTKGCPKNSRTNGG